MEVSTELCTGGGTLLYILEARNEDSDGMEVSVEQLARVVQTLLYILGTRNECCNGMEGRVGIAPVLSTELKLTISSPLRHYWN